MIGGGQGAFIGAIHRMAANLDGEIELVCGAFSSDPAKSKATGAALYLSPERVYDSFEVMLKKEKKLPVDQRMDFVSIVTPNHLHFAPAKMALENGFHVVLDKPATFDLAEAKKLRTVVEKSGKILCLTHTYTGYPMVKEARQIVRAGRLGRIRKVYVEYPQGWLSTFLEGNDQKQAAWRTDPKRSGIAGSMGDIGTHAFNLAEYVSGLKVSQLCADVNIVVEGRRLDDDGAALLKFDNGASGVLMATQIAAGEENTVKIRVYGELGGLEWQQADANTLLLKWPDHPVEILRAGNAYLSSFARHNCRTPAGHPEGYLEAFANHYRNFSLAVRALESGQSLLPEWLDFPGIGEGLRAMAFIETIIKSSRSRQKWLSLPVD